MKYLKELYIYNKKYFIIGFLVLILALSILIYYINTIDNNQIEIKEYDLVLFGKEEVVVYQNEEYQEIGYHAVLNNQIVTDDVIVDNLVNTKKLGIYEITYTIGNIKKVRRVKVIENPNDSIEDIKLYLIGDETIILGVGEKYEELGCLAYDKNNNDISNRVNIEGSVNTSIPGTYYITYLIDENGEIKTLKREIIVKEELDLSFNYKKDLTNQDIVIDIVVNGDDFSYIKFPNGVISKDKKSSFTAKENGVYYFYLFDNNKNNKLFSVNITNIDKIKPKVSCTAKTYSNKTEIIISATDNLGIDKYVYNKSYVSKDNFYTINSKLSNVNVSVYDKAGNISEVNCLHSYVKGLWIAHMKNSKESVSAAIQEGFYGIEVDVRQSGNTFKLYHDSDNNPYRGYNLDMFLDTCKEKGITAVLDLKKVDDYSKLISLVKSKNMQNDTIYQTSVSRVKKLYNVDSNARIWVLIDDDDKNINGSTLNQIKEVRSYIEGINMLALNVDSNDINTIHNLDLTICAFSYRSKLYSNADASTLRKWGSDYIMANNIDDN